MLKPVGWLSLVHLISSNSLDRVAAFGISKNNLFTIYWDIFIFSRTLSKIKLLFPQFVRNIRHYWPLFREMGKLYDLKEKVNELFV